MLGSGFHAHRFFHSRWSTRGWTLKELIAPAKISFYSMHRNLIDSKSGLSSPILKVTGINFDILIMETFQWRAWQCGCRGLLPAKLVESRTLRTVFLVFSM